MNKIYACLLILTSCARAPSYTWLHDYLKATPASSTYRIAPGDRLSVKVWNQEKLSGEQDVRADGFITMPLLGDLFVLDKTVPEASELLKEKFKSLVANPDITIHLIKNREIEVAIIGEVNSPGFYRMPANSGLIDAIAISKGLNDFANENKIFIIRKNPSIERLRVTYKELLYKSKELGQFTLKNGDAVVIE